MPVIDFPTGVPQDFLSTQISKRLNQPHDSEQEFRDDRELFFYIFDIPNSAAQQNAAAELKKIALNIWGIKTNDFKGLLKAYKNDWMRQKGTGERAQDTAYTCFTGQPLELRCGKWAATDAGVWKVTDENGNQDHACAHPLTIEKLLKNRQTGQHKVVLAYKPHGKWERTIQPKSLISNSQTVISLANLNIDVSSENAKEFVSYLRVLMNMNRDKIPINQSTTSLGWIDDGFIPFTGDIEFDGEAEYSGMFEAVKQKGDYQTWLKHMQDIRRNIYVRIITSASFASVLARPLGILPFVVHIHGKGSGGKTVSQMAAASIWADPEIGRYFRTMNATANYTQRIAAFLQDLPLISDELQTIKQSAHFENYDRFIYSITGGMDKGRAKAKGGIDDMGTWNNIFIFSGEEPITMDNSGGGAKNRVIEMDISDMQIIADGYKTSNLFRENYGFAGRMFIDMITSRLDDVKKVYKAVFQELKPITDDKQAMAAACIITADRLAAREIFKEAQLQPDEYEFIVRSKVDSSIAERAYVWLVDTIGINQNKFEPIEINYTGEVWGKIESNICYFISAKLNELMDKAGYNMKAIQNEWINHGRLIPDKIGRATDNCRILKQQSRCYKITVPL